MLRRGRLVAEADHAVVLGEGLGIAPQFGGERSLGAGPERGQQPARLDPGRGQQGEMQIGRVDRAERGSDIARPLLSVLSRRDRPRRVGDAGRLAPETVAGRWSIRPSATSVSGPLEQSGQPADGAEQQRRGSAGRADGAGASGPRERQPLAGGLADQLEGEPVGLGPLVLQAQRFGLEELVKVAALRIGEQRVLPGHGGHRALDQAGDEDRVEAHRAARAVGVADVDAGGERSGVAADGLLQRALGSAAEVVVGEGDLEFVEPAEIGRSRCESRPRRARRRRRASRSTR